MPRSLTVAQRIARLFFGGVASILLCGGAAHGEDNVIEVEEERGIEEAGLSIQSTSAFAGTVTNLKLSLATGGARVTAVQWEMGFPAAWVPQVVIAPGAAAQAAGKIISCVSGVGAVTCMAFGLDGSQIASGDLATVAVTLAASITAPTVPISVSKVMATDAAGGAVGITGASGIITILPPVAAIEVSSLSCSPTVVSAPGSSSCVVGVSGPAPAGGFAVAITDNSAYVTVPASVTVVAGASSATFTASVSAVASDQSAIITAAAGGRSRTATLSLTGPPQLSGLSCTPSILFASQTATCTVQLTKTAGAAITVALASSQVTLRVPTSVQIGAGSSRGTFTATAGSFSVGAQAILTATLASTQRTAEILLTVQAAPSEVSCAPAVVLAPGSSACTVSLNGAAPAGGLRIALASSSASVAIPASVTVPAAAMSVGFTASVSAIAVDQSATLTASAAGVSRSFTLNLVTAPRLSELSCALTTLRRGQSTTCTVKLNKSAVSAATIALASSQPLLTVPSSVLIGAGASSASFAATAGAVAASVTATVMGTWKGVTVSTPLYLLFSNANSLRKALEGRDAANIQSEGLCSPGSWASLFGAGFTGQEAVSANTLPLPAALGGVQVKVNGEPAPVLFVSDSQINFQCPALAPGTPLRVTVESEDGTAREPLETVMHEASPSIYTLDANMPGQGAVLIANTNDLAMEKTDRLPSRAAAKGGYISIFANGLGLSEEGEAFVGTAAPQDRPLRLRNAVKVYLGGMELEPAFAGLAPGAVGLHQINVAVPEDSPSGPAVPLHIEVTLPDGSRVSSNPVTVAIE